MNHPPIRCQVCGRPGYLTDDSGNLAPIGTCQNCRYEKYQERKRRLKKAFVAVWPGLIGLVLSRCTSGALTTGANDYETQKQ